MCFQCVNGNGVAHCTLAFCVFYATVVVMEKKKQHWTHDEFGNIALGDKRLDKRFIQVVEQLATRPEDTINRAIEDAADKKAAYRLFDNAKCSAQKIFAVHQQQVAKRMQGHRIVLSIHDTTFLNYDAHEATEGLGDIGGHSGEDQAQGLIFHTGFGVTDTGLPLGLQHFKVWAREEKKAKGEVCSVDKKQEEEEKESHRWAQGLKEAKSLYGKDTQMIFIADREGDIFNLFFEAKNSNADILIRSKHDRMIIGKEYYLSWHLEKMASAGEILVEDPKNNRTARLDVKYSKVAFNDPIETRAKHLARFDINRVELYVVDTEEINPPEGVEPLHWRLLTSLPVKTTQDAEQIIRYYRKRWHIESYFKVLKKGCCDVEDCRLQTAKRLEKYLAVFSVIAWRIFWMVHMNRVDPKAESSSILTPLEQKTLYCRTNKTKVYAPDSPLTVRDSIRLIAKMGGFNGRKGDGEPGMITLWRGWIRLQDMVEMYEIMA